MGDVLKLTIALIYIPLLPFKLAFCHLPLQTLSELTLHKI